MELSMAMRFVRLRANRKADKKTVYAEHTMSALLLLAGTEAAAVMPSGSEAQKAAIAGEIADLRKALDEMYGLGDPLMVMERLDGLIAEISLESGAEREFTALQADAARWMAENPGYGNAIVPVAMLHAVYPKAGMIVDEAFIGADEPAGADVSLAGEAGDAAAFDPMATVVDVPVVDPEATIVDPMATVVDVSVVDPDATVVDAPVVDPDATVVDASVVDPDATVVDASLADPGATVVDASAKDPDATVVDLPAADSGTTEEAAAQQKAEEEEEAEEEAEEAEPQNVEGDAAAALRKAEETLALLQAEIDKRNQEIEDADKKRAEAEEAENLRREAEEAENLRREAEEAENLRREAEEAENRRREAEEAENRRREAEEAENRRREAEEAENRRKAEEEAARRRVAEGRKAIKKANSNTVGAFIGFVIVVVVAWQIYIRADMLGADPSVWWMKLAFFAAYLVAFIVSIARISSQQRISEMSATQTTMMRFRVIGSAPMIYFKLVIISTIFPAILMLIVQLKLGELTPFWLHFFAIYVFLWLCGLISGAFQSNVASLSVGRLDYSQLRKKKGAFVGQMLSGVLTIPAFVFFLHWHFDWFPMKTWVIVVLIIYLVFALAGTAMAGRSDASALQNE